jgi:hypothetical protein
MTMNNGPEDKKPGQPGAAGRPFATLDLKAEDISPKQEAAAGEEASPEPLTGEHDQPPLLGAPNGGAHHGNGGPTMSTVLTHIGAGALGAVLALIATFSVIGSDGATPESVTVDTEGLKAQIAGSNQKIAALEGELRKTTAAASAAQSGGAGAIETLKRDLAALSERINAVDTKPAPAAPSDEAIQRSVQQSIQQSVAPLGERLAKAEQQIEGVAKAQTEFRTDSKGPALALALYNLRKAANEGLPYGTELKTVADMSPVALDLAALEAYRDKGIHSIGRIRADFDTAASAAWEAENRPADESFLAEAWSRAKSLVRVKRKGDVPGDGTMAILARAEHRLEAGELRTALAEAEKLQGPARDAMAPWLADLKTKIAADDALAKAEATLLTALGREETAKRGG